MAKGPRAAAPSAVIQNRFPPWPSVPLLPLLAQNRRCDDRQRGYRKGHSGDFDDSRDFDEWLKCVDSRRDLRYSRGTVPAAAIHFVDSWSKDRRVHRLGSANQGDGRIGVGW